VLAGSFFRSVPQIIKIIQNRSAEGLSITSNISEPRPPAGCLPGWLAAPRASLQLAQARSLPRARC
jgi:hypothetical protein